MTGTNQDSNGPDSSPVDPSPDRRWTISLQMVLIVAFGGLVFLAVATVLGFSVYSNFTNTTTLLNQRSVQLLQSMEREIRSETDQAERAITGLALTYQDSLFSLDDARSVRLRLKFILRTTPVIEMIHVSDQKGQYIGVSRDRNGGIDNNPVSDVTRLQALFPDTPAKSDSPVWGEPLAINNTLYHNVHIHLSRDGKVLGKVVASIGRQSMNRIIVNLGRAYETTAFVLNTNNEVIAHSRRPDYFDGMAETLLSKFPDPALRKILTASNTTGEKADLSSFVTIREVGDRIDGVFFLTKELAGYSRIPYTLGAYFPKYDAMDEIRRTFTSALIGFAALILSIIAAVLLASRISKPLREISQTAGKFTRFEIDDIKPLPPSRVREINEQTTAINSVRTAISEFTHYVPKSLVSGIVKTGTAATQSLEREVSILFSDIVGFTRMSEHLNATETAELLNKHFELVCNEIDTCEGTIDKFMGDGIMAYWGAPETDLDHADHAFQAATKIAEALRRDNETRIRQGKDKLQLRIGIHTGHVVVGNIGGGERQNYTIIGDSVNVAQRLEQMGKELIGDEEFMIVASATAKQAASHRFRFESMGERMLRGREMPISLFAFQPDID